MIVNRSCTRKGLSHYRAIQCIIYENSTNRLTIQLVRWIKEKRSQHLFCTSCPSACIIIYRSTSYRVHPLKRHGFVYRKYAFKFKLNEILQYWIFFFLFFSNQKINLEDIEEGVSILCVHFLTYVKKNL